MGLQKLIESSKKFKFDEVHWYPGGEIARQSFLEKFPLNSLKNLSLEQYALGNDKNNFCYWLEFKKVLFGIGGGSSLKHGLYKAKKDGNYYAGQGKENRQLSGDNLNIYFENLKKGIVTALSLADKDEIEQIKDLEIPIWNMVLQKILSIYYPDKFIAMGSTDVLLEFAEDIELTGIELIPDNAIQINYECNKILKSQEEFKNWDYWKLGVFVFETYKKEPKKDYRKDFTSWLSTKFGNNAGTVNSYIKAIDITSKNVEKEIFTITDDIFLNKLYVDLIEKQRDPNGKYFHEDAASYGSHGFFSASIKSYREFLRSIKSFNNQNMQNMKAPLNKILFGPPGTGKTFNSINESLQIVDPDFYRENEGSRDLLNKRFKELLIKDWEKTTGQIAFCTFHQSFSYEDFVEGIKPKINDNKEVFYEIEDGVFKRICQLADSSISAVKMKKEGKLSWDEEKFKKASFYKLSLGDSKKTEDKEIYEYCRDNNYIAIGFGKDHDFSRMTETEIKEFCEEKEDLSDNDAQQLNYFVHYLKVGNYVLISNGNKFVRALGKVVGNYEFDPNAPIRYSQFRKVEWIFKDENIPIEELYNRGLSQQTIYKIDENGLKKEFFVNQGQLVEPEAKKVKDYVLIIDEINRGNVSSIFGELITLIEPDKRAGKNEELEVTLPYSKDPFKVPHNVYIVGTMNTADRSIEALDTALRRRFSFKEMPPKPNLILSEGDSGKVNGLVEGIKLKDLLETINNRIEKLIDKDHKIGHSYFLKVNDLPSLKKCFKNEVIPLLEEYFFGDYGKIGLVLGDSFVVKDETEAFEFAEFEGYDADVSSDLKERSVYKIRPSKKWDFKSI